MKVFYANHHFVLWPAEELWVFNVNVSTKPSSVSEQKQRARPAEAQGQTEQEEGFPGVRLPVQLVLRPGTNGPPGTAPAHVGLQ